jgi:Holliday junction resolvasome RuvABC endonuclease subunit
MSTTEKGSSPHNRLGPVGHLLTEGKLVAITDTRPGLLLGKGHAEMKIIGLDLGLVRTGIAIINADGLACWHIKTDASKTLQERIATVADEIMHATPLDCKVLIENHSFGSFGAGVRQLAELAGVVKFQLWRAGIPFALVAPMTLKKWATGTGKKMDKSIILHKVALKTGVEPSNDDEADAVALADFGWHVLNPESPRRELLQYEKDCIAAFSSPKVKKPRKRNAE